MQSNHDRISEENGYWVIQLFPRAGLPQAVINPVLHKYKRPITGEVPDLRESLPVGHREPRSVTIASSDEIRRRRFSWQ